MKSNLPPGLTVARSPQTGRWGVFCAERGRIGSAGTRARAIALAHEIGAARAERKEGKA